MNLFAKRPLSSAVLVLGAGDKAGKLYKELAEPNTQASFSIRGFVPIEKQDSAIPASLLINGDATLEQLAEKLEISEIVVVRDHAEQTCPVQELLDCKLAGIRLSDLESFLKRVRVNSDRLDEEYDSLLVNFN